MIVSISDRLSCILELCYLAGRQQSALGVDLRRNFANLEEVRGTNGWDRKTPALRFRFAIRRSRTSAFWRLMALYSNSKFRLRQKLLFSWCLIVLWRFLCLYGRLPLNVNDLRVSTEVFVHWSVHAWPNPERVSVFKHHAIRLGSAHPLRIKISTEGHLPVDWLWSLNHSLRL